MKARWPLAVALIAAAAAAAWLLSGTGKPAHKPAGERDAGAGDVAEGAGRPGLAAAKPPTLAEEAPRSGRCEISGTVRREGKPAAARVEARRGPHEQEGVAEEIGAFESPAASGDASATLRYLRGGAPSLAIQPGDLGDTGHWAGRTPLGAATRSS